MTSALTIAILALLCGVLAALLVLRRKGAPKASGARETTHSFALEELRALGLLTAFKAVTKEIVTARDHSLGDIGKRYLEWLVTSRKMAMIFAFDIDFQYDLRDPAFRIESPAPGEYVLTMPPCIHAVNIRDVTFYDEQAGKFLPLIVPDVVNNLFGGGFNEQERNKLLEEARTEAEKLAGGLSRQLSGEAQQSARQTLEMLARSFGAAKVTVVFPETAAPAPAPAAAAK
jgi:hypothetical protein